MKAAVFTRFGPPEVLRLEEIERPAPGQDDVLVKVHATTVTAAESLLRRGRPWWGRIIIGFRKPRRGFRVLGLELSGEVVAVGRDVRRFQVGDEVFGFTSFGMGACAEYKRMPANGSLERKPRNVSHQESAAAVDGASTALFFLRDKAKLQSGDRVLVIGASGSIGTYAVQLAKHFGAEVTGVCSARNEELVRSLGADQVIDYTRADFAGTGTYDIIFDTVGKSSYAHCKGSLAPGGRYVATVGLRNNFLALWTSVIGGKKVVTGMSSDKRKALPLLRELIEGGKLSVVIDRCYTLATVVEAHRHVEGGHKRGNVVVEVAHPAHEIEPASP